MFQKVHRGLDTQSGFAGRANDSKVNKSIIVRDSPDKLHSEQENGEAETMADAARYRPIITNSTRPRIKDYFILCVVMNIFVLGERN